VTLFTRKKLDNSRSVSNDESEGSKMIIWSHRSGSFPLADFDEYEEVAKLEKKDRELYIKLRQGGYDHQDAQVAVTDSTVEFV
jgi:hypothetical protein